MRVIVVEGSDGCGKSTLVKRLAKEFGYETLHMSIPEPIDKPFAYWMSRIISALKTEPHGLIIDRLHWSEDVYGGKLRDGSKLTPHERWLLEGWLIAHNGFIIRCELPRDEALENVLKNPSAKHHDLDSFDVVFNAYLSPWKTALDVVPYSYAVCNDDWIFATVRAQSVAMPSHHQGIGSTTPKVLLVGEQHNVCERPFCDDPIVFGGNSSGNYLRQAMSVAGLDLNTTHITNALHGGEPLYAVDDVLTKYTRIVALGKVADKELTRRGFEHNTVPHPQYWKRFCYKELDQYAELIKEATS